MQKNCWLKLCCEQKKAKKSLLFLSTLSVLFSASVLTDTKVWSIIIRKRGDKRQEGRNLGGGGGVNNLYMSPKNILQIECRQGPTRVRVYTIATRCHRHTHTHTETQTQNNAILAFFHSVVSQLYPCPPHSPIQLFATLFNRRKRLDISLCDRIFHDIRQTRGPNKHTTESATRTNIVLSRERNQKTRFSLSWWSEGNKSQDKYTLASNANTGQFEIYCMLEIVFYTLFYSSIPFTIYPLPKNLAQSGWKRETENNTKK